MNETARARLLAPAAWAVSLAAAGLLFLFVVVYRMNGAEQDHLASTVAFYLWEHNAPMGHYLFQQHNEHRILVPRLVILGLGLLTRWNNVPEMFAHAALMCATAVLLFGAFRRELGPELPRGRALFAFLPAVLLALSPRSYEALMGFGFPHYLAILFYVASLRLLVFGVRSASFWGAVLCAEAATFSLANGLWMWPVGLAVLLTRRLLVRAALWVAIAGATLFAYFHGYLPTGNHPDPAFFAQHPWIAVEHFLALNGTVLATTVPLAIAFGALAFVLYLWVCGLVVRHWWRDGERPPYGFWLVASVLGSNATVTAGRALFGPVQALDSRYAAMIALAPIGLYSCLYVRRHAWRAAPALTRVTAAFMITGYAIASIQTWIAAPEWYSRKKENVYRLYTFASQPDSEVSKFWPIVREGRWFGTQLQDMRLNVFAEPHVSAAALIPTPVRPQLRIDTVNGRPRSPSPIAVNAADAVEIRGYAFNAAGTGPAPAMFLTIDGKTDLPAVTGLYRPGPHGAAKWTGFAGSFAGFVLTPGAHTLSLKVVTDEARHAYVTDPIARIIRR